MMKYLLSAAVLCLSAPCFAGTFACETTSASGVVLKTETISLDDGYVKLVYKGADQAVIAEQETPGTLSLYVLQVLQTRTTDGAFRGVLREAHLLHGMTGPADSAVYTATQDGAGVICRAK